MKYSFFILFVFFSCKFDDQGPYMDYTNMYFDSIELTHGNLTLYDLDTGPDAELLLMGDGETFSFPVKINLSELPYEWDLSQDSINVTDGVWQLLVQDIDADGTNEEMINLKFNPYQKYLQFNEDTAFDLFYEHWQLKLRIRVD